MRATLNCEITGVGGLSDRNLAFCQQTMTTRATVAASEGEATGKKLMIAHVYALSTFRNNGPLRV